MDPTKTENIHEMYVRFQKDLEFVQMLSNPWYITCKT